jgi:exopolysaccharide production protein ExoY
MSNGAEWVVSMEMSTTRQRASLYARLALKRILDVLLSFCLLIVLAPVFLVTALAVYLSSPGPILFRQERWGRHERPFGCWKFRSMYTDQDSRVPSATLQDLHAKGFLFKPKKDPRVTRIGSFLRKSSLDELPQLFNVLTGDMSLVGPRPLMLHMLMPYPGLRRVRCLVRPGITGLWQVSARHNNESALEMAEYDLAYVRNLSFWLDVQILLKTPRAVLRGDGAH